MPLLSKQALPVSYRLKSAQRGEVVKEERGEILDCTLLTLMSVWEEVAPQKKKKFQRKLSKPLIKTTWLKSSFLLFLTFEQRSQGRLEHAMTTGGRWLTTLHNERNDRGSLSWRHKYQCRQHIKVPFFLCYLWCQSFQPTHEWFIERKMSPHVVTRLICLTGTTGFQWIKRGTVREAPNCKIQREQHFCLSQLSVMEKR